MSNPKDTINKLLNDYYQKKGLNPAIQVAHELLKKPVISQTDMSTQELNAIFNGEVCETVLQIMIQDFMKRNPTKTASWRYNKSVILSDLETQSSKFLTEIDALLFTPECIYIFECKSYAGDKQLVGKGTIKRSNGNDCDVYSQNSLHLKILKQWLNRFSQHPFYQMVLFDFSSGTMNDKRTASAKKELPLVTDTNLFQLLHTSRLGVWHAEDIDLISKRFATETEKLHAKHLDYVKSINHRR